MLSTRRSQMKSTFERVCFFLGFGVARGRERGKKPKGVADPFSVFS